MLRDVFLRDYFDSIVDQEEPNHLLNEVLITWLIDEGVFEGPINSIEDARVEDIEILSAQHTLAGDDLVIHAGYTATLTCDYVDRDGLDSAFTARLELAGQFTLAETGAAVDNGELRVTYRLKEALPAQEIELLQYS